MSAVRRDRYRNVRKTGYVGRVHIQLVTVYPPGDNLELVALEPAFRGLSLPLGINPVGM